MNQNGNNIAAEPTLSEVLEFLQENVVVKEDLKTMATKEDLKLLATKEDLKAFATKEDLRKMEHEILDNMDKKLDDLKGDLVMMTRKEDRKVVGLISLLRDKSVLTQDEAKGLLGMEPFPQLFA